MRWNRGLFWEGAQLNNTVCWIKKSFTLKTLAFFKELLHICHICISKDKMCFHSNHPILLFHAGQSTCTETKKELRDNLLRYLWLWEGWGNILVTLRVDTETYCHPHSRNLGHISSPPPTCYCSKFKTPCTLIWVGNVYTAKIENQFSQSRLWRIRFYQFSKVLKKKEWESGKLVTHFNEGNSLSAFSLTWPTAMKILLK